MPARGAGRGERLRPAWGALAVALLLGCGRTSYIPPLEAEDDGVAVGPGVGGGPASSVASAGGEPGVGGSGGAPSLDSRLVEVVLGSLPTGQPTHFEVDASTLGFTVVVHGPTEDATTGVQRLRAPNLEAVLDAYQVPGPSQWFFARRGTTAAAVPQTDAASAMPTLNAGTWEVTVGDPFGGQPATDVRLWLRQTDDGVFHGGLIDVNVFAIPGIASEAYVEQVLAHAFDDYAGLQLGEVVHHPLAEAYAVVDEVSYLDAFEQTSAGALRPALNLLVVDELVGELFGAVGVAAGVPGVGVVHGSRASGVLVAFQGDEAFDALIVRHETGHLAGLFHTTETEPGAEDPLSDTDTCSDVLGILYDCPDADNVMFPIAETGGTVVTPMQGRVLAGSTLYRGELVETRDAEGSARRGRGRSGSSPGLLPVPSAAAPLPGVPPLAARLLRSHWCHRAPGLDPFARLRETGISADALLELSGDAAVPLFLRARALAAAGFVSTAPRQHAERLHAVLRSSSPAAMRRGAARGLVALAQAGDELAAEVVRSARGDTDRAVAAIVTPR